MSYRIEYGTAIPEGFQPPVIKRHIRMLTALFILLFSLVEKAGFSHSERLASYLYILICRNLEHAEICIGNIREHSVSLTVRGIYFNTAGIGKKSYAEPSVGALLHREGIFSACQNAVYKVSAEGFAENGNLRLRCPSAVYCENDILRDSLEGLGVFLAVI